VDEIKAIEKVLRRIGREDYADDIREVYELTKKLKDRINEIDNDDIRECALYASVAFLIWNTNVDYDARLAVLEGIKFELLELWSRLDKALGRKIWGDVIGQD